MRFKNSKGQATLEYLLIVVFIILGVSISINNLATYDGTVGMCRLWAAMVRGIVTGCANCPNTSSDLSAGGGAPVCYTDAP